MPRKGRSVAIAIVMLLIVVALINIGHVVIAVTVIIGASIPINASRFMQIHEQLHSNLRGKKLAKQRK